MSSRQLPTPKAVKAADRIIHNLTSSRTRWQLTSEMNVRQFYKLAYPIGIDGQDWFLFKFSQPKINITLQGEPVDLFYGNVYSLSCECKSVGMLINTPSLSHKVVHECLISAPKSVKNVDNLEDKAEVLVLNNEYSVHLLANTVQYIAAFDPSMQRMLN